jgi:hypothetical protein
MNVKKVAFTLTLVVAICVCAVMTIAGREKEKGKEKETRFTFQTIFFPGDTFTQLLGINDFDVIAGYHGANVNKGFVFTFPNTFTPENFPNSAQTQVIGINNRGWNHSRLPGHQRQFHDRGFRRYHLQPASRPE